MVEFKCPRCGYLTFVKGNMQKHINRKNLCSPILSSVIPTDDFLNEQRTG